MGSKDILGMSGLNIVTTKEAMADRQDLQIEAQKEERTRPLSYIPKGDIAEAVKAGLIPQAYADCEFDIDKIQENKEKQMLKSSRAFSISRFSDYKDITTGLISTIISNKLPRQSYIIGAPNGFGKTSFVNSCIIKLHALGRMCTPYISLSELAEVKFQNDKRLIEGISAREVYKKEYVDATIEKYKEVFYEQFESGLYTKKPINLIGNYSWSEYMNCDILFCYFTDVSSKVLESEILKTAVTIRGTKGLPTIAMISTSLEPYKRDKMLREYVWNEILSYNESEESCDRLRHISCYKNYNTPLIPNTKG